MTFYRLRLTGHNGPKRCQSLAFRRELPAKCFEEIENEGHFVVRTGWGFRGGRLQHREAFAVRVHVIIRHNSQICNWPGDQSCGLSAWKESPETLYVAAMILLSG